jgi:hypothetical protein
MVEEEDQEEWVYECPECGHIVSNIVFACPNCGTAFDDEEEEVAGEAEGEIACPNCGTMISPDATICYACGTEIGRGGEAEEPAEAEEDEDYCDDTPYYLLEFGEDSLYNILGGKLIEIERMNKESESSGPIMYSPSNDKDVKVRPIPRNAQLSPASKKDIVDKIREEAIRMAEEQYRNKRIGRRYFDSCRKKLHYEICVKFKYCEKCKEYKDVNSAYYAIMGVISTLNIPVGVGSILGAILIKKKLEKFCECGH